MNITQLKKLNAELERTNKLTKELAKQTLIVSMTSIIQSIKPTEKSTSFGGRNE